MIETDASKIGWGAACQGVRTGGLWSQMEKKLHINRLKLLAGSFAVKSFTKNRLCAHVVLRMDNTTAVAYVNQLGGTHSLVLSNLALAWAFDKGFEYQTINKYRSALSGVLPPIEGFAVGQHPLVVRLLKGILNMRPAMPHYQSSWDVSLVLNYFRAQKIMIYH